MTAGPVAGFDISAGAATDTGLVRLGNEDCVFAGRTVFVVADGMGGHAAGEVASELIVNRLAGLDGRGDLKLEDLREGIAQANEDVLEYARRHPQHAGMGATLSGIALAWYGGSRHWVAFNAGDCRVYRYARGALVQLTTDHTEAAELVAAGMLDPVQAAGHPSRHVVTRSLGSEPAPEADFRLLPPSAGEVFLLCSDGLFGEVADASIAQVLRAEPSPVRAAAALIRLAVDHGGRDNVSAVVVLHADAEQRDAAGADERTIPRQAPEEV
jgi:protein phosphatase